MEVTLADGSQVEASTTCLVPLVVCSARSQALHCVVECRVLPRLNHDVVLGVDWLQATNPVIDWQACTVSVSCDGQGGSHVLHALPM